MSIQVKNLRKAYHGRRVLEDVSFTVASGQMIALVGPSGSGKSTLLNCLGTLDRPDSGSIQLLGTDLKVASQRTIRRLRRTAIAFLFQNYGLVDSWSIDANLDLALEFSKLDKRERATAKAAALERVGLPGIRASATYALSGGEQQRIALARLILKSPRVVLADEPTGSLDAENAQCVLDVLDDLRSQGATVVISTHDDDVAGRADCCLALPATRMQHLSSRP